MPSYTKNIIKKQSINQYILSLYPKTNVKIVLEGNIIQQIDMGGISQGDFDSLLVNLKSLYPELF